MVKVKCPIPPCDYETDDLDPAVVAALITAHSELHKNNNVPAKVEKVKRPTISAAGTSEEWSYFLTRWNDYVEATRIKDKELVIQLLECCDENIRRDLTRSHGGSLTSKPKDEVIQAIRQLAVREENIMVARVTLQNMTQDRDETVRAFGARLRGQTSVCKFLLKCECDRDINYTDSVLRDVLIRGLADSDIQLELLVNQNQNMTLEEVFKFVEAKEAGKRSASKLLDSQGAEAASSYRRNKTASRTKQDKPQSKPSEICSYCGKTGHGTKAPAYIRKKQCDAYGKTCSKCKHLNHFASVCKSTRQSDKNTTTEHESAVFDSLCVVMNYDSNYQSKVINLDHHVYNELNDIWTKTSSKAQPYVSLNAQLMIDDYIALDHKSSFPSKTRTVTLSAMADTGCQSCLAGIKVAQLLGLNEHNLIPVTLKMHAANNRNIKIIGAAIVRFSGTDNSGNTLETRQVVYITDSSEKLFLSREACTALGIISNNFPTIGETINAEIETEDNATDNVSSDPVCECPKREPPPPMPSTLPFPATEEYRADLE